MKSKMLPKQDGCPRAIRSGRCSGQSKRARPPRPQAPHACGLLSPNRKREVHNSRLLYGVRSFLEGLPHSVRLNEPGSPFFIPMDLTDGPNQLHFITKASRNTLWLSSLLWRGDTGWFGTSGLTGLFYARGPGVLFFFPWTKLGRTFSFSTIASPRVECWRERAE